MRELATNQKWALVFAILANPLFNVGPLGFEHASMNVSQSEWARTLSLAETTTRGVVKAGKISKGVEAMTPRTNPTEAWNKS
jgi:hypothetical protein